MELSAQISQAVRQLKQGGIVAYPTEGVFGLGVDPFNEVAVNRLLALKRRPVAKGLILIAADFADVTSLIASITNQQREQLATSWPGPITWLCPATEKVPTWIKGEFDAVALRVTAHPVASELCRQFGGPIVSTSANPSTEPAATTWQAVENYFGTAIDGIIKASVGGLNHPTPIRDLISGVSLR